MRREHIHEINCENNKRILKKKRGKDRKSVV